MPIFGRKLSADERAAALDYYQASLEGTAFQTREGDLYNSALMVHMNSLDTPSSAAVMVLASRRLAESAQELKRRQGALSPLPDIDLVTADYSMWTLLYEDYGAWADAQHDAFVAIEAGRTPVIARVQELMAAAEATRKRAEDTSQRLLKAIGLKGTDIQRLTAAARQTAEATDWKPSDR